MICSAPLLFFFLLVLVVAKISSLSINALSVGLFLSFDLHFLSVNFIFLSHVVHVWSDSRTQLPSHREIHRDTACTNRTVISVQYSTSRIVAFIQDRRP